MEINLYNFQRYLNQPEALTFPEMEEIHRLILSHADVKNSDFIELWEAVLSNAISYTMIRSEGMLLMQDVEKDFNRTSQHNSVLSSFLVLERFFIKQNWESEAWSKKLFLQDYLENRSLFDLNSHRKRVGDFANYLTFVYALHNR